jgi:NitT/TauT family transport system ATP-binding protein
MAAGLDEPTSGSIDRGSIRPGCVFQQANLLPWRSVLRNVELFAELDGVDRSTRRAWAEDAVRQVGLAGFEDHLPHQLSGGMQMRAALARALVAHAEVLLFDEPFAAVDELRRERLGEELTRIFHRERFAGLFITHSVTEAVLLSTEVLVMSARPGRITHRFAVPFAYPRSPELRFDPAFVDLAREVSQVLRAAADEADEADEVGGPADAGEVGKRGEPGRANDTDARPDPAGGP